MSASNKITKTHMGLITFLAPEFPLTESNVSLLKQEIECCKTEGELKVTIGFKNIPNIDSAGLEALIEVQEDLEQKGGEIKIVHPNPVCRDILIATRLDERFGISSHSATSEGSFI